MINRSHSSLGSIAWARVSSRSRRIFRAKTSGAIPSRLASSFNATSSSGVRVITMADLQGVTIRGVTKRCRFKRLLGLAGIDS
jgi:hypothetical protein